MPILLVFGAYLRVLYNSAPSKDIIKRGVVVRKAIKALRKLRAE